MLISIFQDSYIMGFWNKSSDWLPLSNAKAQVEFWKQDLEYSEQYFKYVKSFQGKGIKNYDKIFKIAVKDVEVSKEGLRKAQIKLKETIERESRK